MCYSVSVLITAMLIVSWNVNFANEDLVVGLRYIKKLDPDIICLQEFPDRHIDQLPAILKGYNQSKIIDFVSTRESKYSSYLVILTKFPIIKEQEINYASEQTHSLWNNIVYRYLTKITQNLKLLKIHVSVAGQEFVIGNLHLPCSNSARERIHMLGNALSNFSNTDGNVIVCGDFNIVTGPVFNWLFGWLRGFGIRDYFYNERSNADRLIAKHKFMNVFANQKTSSAWPLSFSRMQFDHILIHGAESKVQQILHPSLGSDHNLLVANLVKFS